MGEKNFEFNEGTRTVTIFKNGEYSIGPKGEEVILLVRVGEVDVTENKPSGTEPNQDV